MVDSVISLITRLIGLILASSIAVIFLFFAVVFEQEDKRGDDISSVYHYKKEHHLAEVIQSTKKICLVAEFVDEGVVKGHSAPDTDSQTGWLVIKDEYLLMFFIRLSAADSCLTELVKKEALEKKV